MSEEQKVPVNETLEANLKKIKNIVMVFSGKGGVGKSTVAANLAIALSEKGLKVGLLDVDIHGPNLAKMLGVENKKLMPAGENRISPVEINPNLSLVSMALLLLEPDLPVIWRGPLKMKAIQQFIQDVEWGELDWLVIDSPPGTGDEPLSVAQLIPASYAIIVTTPQQVSVMDSRKAINFARKLNLKLLGIVENMSGFICPHCGKETNLFKSEGGLQAAEEMNIPFLGKVPIDPEIVESGDSGKPFILAHPDSEASKAFKKIVDKVIDIKK
ncbi:Mrp/NBP35 family ATP-binding protein [bacterium]|nr:Mrp/NBP35 family ATP-binding protein [bacterium]